MILIDVDILLMILLDVGILLMILIDVYRYTVNDSLHYSTRSTQNLMLKSIPCLVQFSVL